MNSMGKSLAFLMLAILSCCGPGAPSKTDITCQSGQGTCYVVHCEARDSQECKSYFPKFCPKGMEYKTYGIITNTQHDYLLECK